jgi:hypothetical protein
VLPPGHGLGLDELSLKISQIYWPYVSLSFISVPARSTDTVN